MKLSKRITHLTPGGSDGWDVFYRARAMKSAGQPVIELTIGEHDIPTHPSILDAMHASATGGHTGYAAVPGTQALRQAVANRIQSRTGVPTTPANILITPADKLPCSQPTQPYATKAMSHFISTRFTPPTPERSAGLVRRHRRSQPIQTTAFNLAPSISQNMRRVPKAC